MAQRLEASARVSIDVKHEMFVALLTKLETSKQLTTNEVDLLRSEYLLLYEEAYEHQEEEAKIIRKCNEVQSEIFVESMSLEKEKMKEKDEENEVVKLNNLVDNVQLDVEYGEKEEFLTRFELGDLLKTHADLTESLRRNQKNNSNLVEPALSALRKDLVDIGDQIKRSEESTVRDERQKDTYLKRLAELQALEMRREEEVKELKEQLSKAENEPVRLRRQTDTTKKALDAMQMELAELNIRIKEYDEENKKREKKRLEAERLKTTLLEKNELHRETLSQRQQDGALIKLDLEQEKRRSHDFATKNVEISILKKNAENQLHSLNDQQAILEKEYADLKRVIKKKRAVSDEVRAVMPKLEEQWSDQEVALKQHEMECAEVKRSIQTLKVELDMHLLEFLELQGVEQKRKEELQQLIETVDFLEADLVRALAEGKRLNKLITVATSHRDLKFRENARLEVKEKQAHYQVKMRQLVIVDLTKRCAELSNRLREFSALYEVVKNERNKYVSLIQNCTQALAEMREKIRILQNEVEILGQEFNTKDKALGKERAAHLNARNQRDSIRQDMSKLLFDYRSKQGVIEQQVLEIDKLNTVINVLEKDMIDLKVKYEQAIKDRNSVGVHLIDSNDELCVLYERSNNHLQSIHAGTVEYASKENELRVARLQAEELERQYTVAEKRVPQVQVLKLSNRQLEEEIAKSGEEMDALSAKLESPSNLERWRPLEGTDVELSLLSDKIALLEVRIDERRAQLIEKDLIYEEISSLTSKLSAQSIAQRQATKTLADQLNELQCRIRDTTKKMLASVSELSMYQATALRLQQEKAQREEVLTKARQSVENGEPPSEDAVRDLYRVEKKRELLSETMQRRHEAERLSQLKPMHSAKTTAEPRPTAYVPEDEIGIPKPYGKAAPFKPTEAGSTMRHIRNPIIPDIEI